MTATGIILEDAVDPRSQANGRRFVVHGAPSIYEMAEFPPLNSHHPGDPHPSVKVLVFGKTAEVRDGLTVYRRTA